MDCRTLVLQLISSIPQSVFNKDTVQEKRTGDRDSEENIRFRGAQSRSDRSRVDKLEAKNFFRASDTE